MAPPVRRVNYMKKLEYLISGLGETRPSLLLHCCCAPCTSACIELLSQHFDVTLLFYNPNIYPEEEFEKRAEELLRLVRELPLSSRVSVVVSPYNPQEFYDAVRGHENDGEGSARCTACFRLRLGKAAEYAAQHGFDYFCTTLTTGTRKDEQRINKIGQELSEVYPVKSLPADFKKKGGFDRSTELSERYGLYRQNYCGCVFSMRESQREQSEKEKPQEL